MSDSLHHIVMVQSLLIKCFGENSYRLYSMWPKASTECFENKPSALFDVNGFGIEGEFSFLIFGMVDF